MVRLGVGGTQVATINSGDGGSFQATYNIPETLQGSQRIAIRLQNAAGNVYAYNWFWNNTSGAADGPYCTGYPTFSISDVENG